LVCTSAQASHHGQPVHRALVRRLRSSGVRGATVLRGMWGFHGETAPHGVVTSETVPALAAITDHEHCSTLQLRPAPLAEYVS
jgi:PII-like signaling protein